MVYFEFATNGEPRSFASREEFDEWLKQLRALYSLEPPSLDNAGLAGHVLNLLQQAFQPTLNELSSTTSYANISNNAVLVRQAVENLFQQKRLIDPFSAFGAALRTLKSDERSVEDRSTSFFAVALFHGIRLPVVERIPNTNNTVSLNRAIARAITFYGAYEFDVLPSAAVAKSEFEGFRVTQEKRLREVIDVGTTDIAKLKSEVAIATGDLQRAREEIRLDSQTVHDQFASISQDAERVRTDVMLLGQELEKAKADANSSYQNLVKSFEARVKTEAAVSYWNWKKWGHVAGMCLVAVAAVLFLCGAGWAFKLLKAHIPSGVDITHPPVWLPIVGILYVVGVVWAARILVRLFFSQVNLREDAAERTTMVKTYLALVKEGAANAEHMGIVLQALFRPSSKGLGSDDGGPQLPVEIILRRLVGETKPNA